MRVTLVLTHQCNMRCTYCYAGDKFSKAMPEQTAWKAIRQAFARDDGEPVTIAFFGGEPMLAFDRMVASARLARKLGQRLGRRVIFSLTTNGTVMHERALRFFREYGFYVGVSLDGLAEEQDRRRPMVGGQGSFERIWRNLELAAQWLSRIDVMMVVSPDTVAKIPAAVSRMRDIGLYRASLIPNVDEPWSESARDAARTAYRRLARIYLDTRTTDRPMFVHPFVEHRAAREAQAQGQPNGACGASSACGFGEREIAVAPSGRIYPCARLVSDDRRPEIALGHVDGGCDPSRVAALQTEAEEANAACGNGGSCKCVPHMPGYDAEHGERLHFLQTLSIEALDTEMAPSVIAASDAAVLALAI